jgi:hypothetical protein
MAAMTQAEPVNENLARYGGPTRFKVDGATYIPSVTPRGMPAFFSYDGGGLLESLFSVVVEALWPARLGFTVQVRRYKGLNLYRSAVRRHYRRKDDAEAYHRAIVDDLRHAKLDFLAG